MRKFTQIKAAIVALLALCITSMSAADVSIATWSFPVSGTSFTAPFIFPAVCGSMNANAKMYFDGTNGSTSWATLSTVASTGFAGTGSSVCLYAGGVGATSSSVGLGSTGAGVNAGVGFVFPTTGYTNLKLTYAVRVYAGGFTTHTWSYSTDGVNYADMPAITFAAPSGATSAVTTVDFSQIATIQNAATVYIKLGLTGATGSGQTRVDFFNFTGVPSGCTPNSIAFSLPAVAKSIGDLNFTIAPSSLNNTTPFEFSSNASNVATVNQTTGEVTIVGQGIALITAAQAEGTSGGTTYCNGSTSYTLTVGSAVKKYNLVKNATDLASGSQYLLVGKVAGTNSTYYAVGNQETSKRPGRIVTDVTGSISSAVAGSSVDLVHPFEFTLISNGTKWQIKDVVNNQYLRPSGTSAGLTLNATPVDWNIDVKTAAGVDSIYADDAVTYTYNILRFNPGASTLAFNAYDVAGAITKPQMYLYKSESIPSAINTPKANIQLTVVGNVVTVFNAESFEVFNVLGAKVKAVVADGSFAQTTLTPGVYIVKANNQSQKIVIK